MNGAGIVYRSLAASAPTVQGPGFRVPKPSVDFNHLVTESGTHRKKTLNPSTEVEIEAKKVSYIRNPQPRNPKLPNQIPPNPEPSSLTPSPTTSTQKPLTPKPLNPKP